MVIDDYYSQIQNESSDTSQQNQKPVRKILVKKKLKIKAPSEIKPSEELKSTENRKDEIQEILVDDEGEQEIPALPSTLNDVLAGNKTPARYEVLSQPKKNNNLDQQETRASSDTTDFKSSGDEPVSKAVKFKSGNTSTPPLKGKPLFSRKDEEKGVASKGKKSRFSAPSKKRIRSMDEIDRDSFIRSHKVKHKKKEEKKLEDIEQTLKSREGQIVQIDEMLSLKEFSEKIGIPLSQLMAEFMKNGMMVNLNSQIDFDTASLIAETFGVTLEKKQSSRVDISDIALGDMSELLKEDNASKLIERPPVVSIMGHVDHGKTSLLDYIRSESVAISEAGGITQSIGAYQTEYNEKKISFLDTPGHEAFTVMRARGAKSTDIAILVVAADEGVKPQTLESISHAKEANIPVIVAINKMDKEGANPDYVKGQLAENGLTPEDWGGDTPMIPVSALTGFGINDLLEMILLISEMQNFQANPDRNAIGTVIESHLDPSLGPVATILVNTGTLQKGDSVTCGKNFGKVKLMKDFKGTSVVKAFPGDPVLLVGLDGVVDGGDILQTVDSIDIAREKAVAFYNYVSLQKNAGASQLDLLLSKIQSGTLQQLKIVLKADTNGSLEAIKNAILKLSTPETTVSIIYAGVGNITEGDVLMCGGSSALLVGFGVQLGSNARKALEETKVEYIDSKIIYHITERLEKIITGMLNPKDIEVKLCEARIGGVFYDSKKFKILGLQGIKEGDSIENNAFVRVIRSDKVIGKGKIESLKFGVEEVKKLEGPVECGIKVTGLGEVAEKDIIEVYKVIKG
ncbi:translation initiation factor IF-2 [Candidatus Gracilibacteria bacterium]|nr:translation initiation factor IF-2 [Candidatus Gracilibacteria bacterium]